MSDEQYAPPLRRQPPVRPGRRPTPWAMLAGLGVLAVLVIVVLVVLLVGDDDGTAADQSPGASTAPPSASASVAVPSGTTAESPSPSASAAGSPTASEGSPTVVAAPEGIFPVGSVVEVTADGLRIREEPSTSAAIVGSVNAGETLFLASNPNNLGPIEADGYAWYLVIHAPGYDDWPSNPPGEGDGPSGDPRISGWVALSSGSEDFVVLAPVDCPAQIDIATFYAHTAWERLACLGNQQVTIEGTYGCGGCGGLAPGTFEPDWLASPLNVHVFSPDWSELPPVVEGMALSLPPDVPALGSEQAGSILRVRGHFNDPRSPECVIAPGVPGEEVPANDLAAEWYCRERFVVESWEVVGTDDDYQSS